jgi:polysaccharide deacetylase family protein (PEP-CTERM system associated)
VPITVTFDLEDNRADPGQELRYRAMTERFLAFCAERDIQATFFVVGNLAGSIAPLLAEVAAAGHEVALHGWDHTPLTELTPEGLADQLERGRAALEDATGAHVTGFRAPIFSLTPATAWARDVLRDAGFAYSSSIVPATNPLNGWPGAPAEPFRWDNGLLEYPCPVAGAGRLSVPCLGGVYLRYVPRPLLARLAARAGARHGAWSYCHPYDLDPDEPFFVLPHANWVTSRILHARRGATLQRLAAAVEAGGGAGRPLGELTRGDAERDDLALVA